MKKLFFISSIILITLSPSCKKHFDVPKQPEQLNPAVAAAKKIDTVKPFRYLPAWPGSYWKYSDGSGLNTSKEYVKDVYSVYSSSSVYKSDTFYVPLYNNKPLWGYMIHDESKFVTVPNTPFVRILSDSMEAGENWNTQFKNHELHWSTITDTELSISIDGKIYFPTIAISHSWRYNTGRVFTTGKSYYTKDIGLVKFETFNDSGAVISEFHLVDYFINK